jgi:hypothetical protein
MRSPEEAPGTRTRGGRQSLIEKAEVVVLALGPESDEGRRSGGLEIVSHCLFEQIPVMVVRHSSTPSMPSRRTEKSCSYVGRPRGVSWWKWFAGSPGR